MCVRTAAPGSAAARAPVRACCLCVRGWEGARRRRRAPGGDRLSDPHPGPGGSGGRGRAASGAAAPRPLPRAQTPWWGERSGPPWRRGLWLGAGGVELWGLFPRVRGRGEGQAGRRVPATGGTLSRPQLLGRHALHLAQAFFLTVSILDPPTPGTLLQPSIGGRIAEGAGEAGAFKKGRVHALHSVPSASAIDEPAGSVGPGTAPNQRAKTGQRQGPQQPTK